MSTDPSISLPPAGWYPDPADVGSHRFWDGGRWTDRTRAVAPQQQTAYPQQQAGYPQQQTGDPQQWADQREPYEYASRTTGPVTVDGVPLAGWWARAAAVTIDILALGVVVAVAALPFYEPLVTGFEAWMNDAIRAAQVGGVMPDYTDPVYGIVGPYTSLSILTITINFIYSAGLQIWRGGTLGMLALGLRVVPVGRGRDHHGLSAGTAVVRNLAYQGLAILWVAWLVDVLLPLANARRQTLHDMAARTQVVKIR